MAEKVEVSDSFLAKLVVTVVVLMTFALWRTSEGSHPPACNIDCPTDFSAVRK
jgi:hypothetical protein